LSDENKVTEEEVREIVETEPDFEGLEEAVLAEDNGEMLLTPVRDEDTVVLSGGPIKRFRKEILRTGTVTKGQGLAKRVYHFSAEDLKKTVANFKAGVKASVPFLFGHDEEDARNTQGAVEDLELSADGQRLYATMSISEEAQRVLGLTPNFGASVGLARDYKGHGPVLFHVAGTHQPVVHGLEPFAALSDPSFTSVDLSGAELETDVTDPKEVQLSDEMKNTETTVEEVKSEETAAPEVIGLSEAEVQARIEAALEAERAKSAAQFEALRQEKHAEKVSMLSDSYKAEGVPPVVVDKLCAILLSHREDEDAVVTLSEGEEAKPFAVITSALDELKGTIRLSEERGSAEDAGSDEPEDLDEVARSLAGL
jgi:hypothetical protein